MGASLSSNHKRAHVTKELERFTKPTGLYPSFAKWDEKIVRKMILDGKVAPIFQGFEEVKTKNFLANREVCHHVHLRQQGTTECPICFLRYVAVNRTRCCKKAICTECYFQVRPPRGSCPCPYCTFKLFVISYAMEDEEKMMEKELETIALFEKLCMPGGGPAGPQQQQQQPSSNIPIATSLAEADASQLPKAEAVLSRTPLATIADRRLIEDQVRKQHSFDRKVEDEELALEAHALPRAMRADGSSSSLGSTSSTSAQRGGAGGGGGGSQVLRSRAEEAADLRRAFLESLGMTQVEDLMLMAAIRQSLEDQQAARSSGGGGGGSSTDAETQTGGGSSASVAAAAATAGGDHHHHGTSSFSMSDMLASVGGAGDEETKVER